MGLGLSLQAPPLRGQITNNLIMSHTNPKEPLYRRQAALAQFAVGSVVEHASSEQELDEARYEYLRTKHLR